MSEESEAEIKEKHVANDGSACEEIQVDGTPGRPPLHNIFRQEVDPTGYAKRHIMKEMRLQERKGTVDGYEWRCRSQSKDNPHDDVRSVRNTQRTKHNTKPHLGTWFSESKHAITIILRLTRYWFGKSMNAFVVNDDLTVTS
ncbi:hypothetical protein TNCV_4140511 [Trichonephila clavipes]|nr:hypothetical protein TNCV_4140511 [Trichonephila clavipes]